MKANEDFSCALTATTGIRYKKGFSRSAIEQLLQGLYIYNKGFFSNDKRMKIFRAP
jgi:hypothetical protein